MYQINLIPWREQRFKKNIILFVMINIFLWLIFLAGYLSYKNHLDIPEKKQQLSQLEQQINATQKTISHLNVLTQEKVEFETLKIINQDMLDTLIQLSNIIPANVQLDSINMTPEEVSIIGQAANQTEMTRFSQAIFNLQYFNKQKSWAISERASDVDFKLGLKHENESNNGL